MFGSFEYVTFYVRGMFGLWGSGVILGTPCALVLFPTIGCLRNSGAKGWWAVGVQAVFRREAMRRQVSAYMYRGSEGLEGLEGGEA